MARSVPLFCVTLSALLLSAAILNNSRVFAQAGEDWSSDAGSPQDAPASPDESASGQPEDPLQPRVETRVIEVESPQAEPGASEPAQGSEEAEGEDDEDEVDPATEFFRGFHFGSYGRIVAASDLRGRTGRQGRIVAFAPRVDEDDTYAEIELRREDEFLGVHTQVVATVAYGGPLFHYDGEFSERIAIRNLFAEATDILVPGLSIWGGSRMARGDDVYLMNFWPLDNLNMVGGGLRFAYEDEYELALHVGMSQPSDPFQQQSQLVPASRGFLPDEIFVLDRPRIVVAARGTWWPFGRFAQEGLKGVLYGEQHYLGAGERTLSDGLSRETLPEDSGFVLGAQVGGYLSAQHAFLNVFFRYARGLGAYDPLGVPFRTGTVVSTGRAEEIRLALSGNWEWRESPDIAFGLQLGAWWRLFNDADPAVFNRGAVSEGAISARPMLFFGEFAGVQVDLSYQGMQSLALDELSGEPEGGGIFKLGIIPFVTPMGRGTYTRPHIRLHYVLSVVDDGARRLFNPADPRASQSLQHFLGVSVEWWFSSSSYAP